MVVQGIVETIKQLRYGQRAGIAFAGYVREAQTWRRVFLHPTGCLSGELPRLHARVAFEIDESSDPRGPRAVAVRVTAEPGPTIERTCSDCGSTFDIDPCAQVWYLEYKSLRLPTRCPACRVARHPDRERARPRDLAGPVGPPEFEDVRVRRL
jgi:hypothetical protein